MSSSKPKMPAPSPAAEAASAAQLQVLQTQQAALQSQLQLQNLLAPMLFKQLGLTPTMKDGQITGFKRAPGSPLSRTSEAQRLTINRTIGALKGKMPVDAQITQELDRQEAALKEQLQRSLGPDYAATTAGQQALADFRQRRSNIIDSAARQDILAMTSASGQQQGIVDAQIQRALGISQGGLPGISMFGQNAAGFGNIVGMDNQLRGAEFQAQQQQSSGFWGGLGSLVGMGAGAVFGGPAGASAGAQLGGGIASIFSPSRPATGVPGQFQPQYGTPVW